MLLLPVLLLAAHLSVGIWGMPFYGHSSGGGGGRLGMANREGSIYLSVFLIIGVFG